MQHSSKLEEMTSRSSCIGQVAFWWLSGGFKVALNFFSFGSPLSRNTQPSNVSYYYYCVRCNKPPCLIATTTTKNVYDKPRWPFFFGCFTSVIVSPISHWTVSGAVSLRRRPVRFSFSMLSLARRTLHRVPSFQDILQGRMSHPHM